MLMSDHETEILRILDIDRISAYTADDLEHVLAKYVMACLSNKDMMEEARELLGLKEDENVVVPKKEYDQLKTDSEFIKCLNDAGVEKWDGYYEAVEMLNKKEKE